jgi:hypothetical protein
MTKFEMRVLSGAAAISSRGKSEDAFTRAELLPALDRSVQQIPVDGHLGSPFRPGTACAHLPRDMANDGDWLEDDRTSRELRKLHVKRQSQAEPDPNSNTEKYPDVWASGMSP